MVKCESLRMNMYRITHTGKSVNFPVTPLQLVILKSLEGCIHGNDKIRKTKAEEDIYDVTTAFSPQFRTNCGHGVTIL